MRCGRRLRRYLGFSVWDHYNACGKRPERSAGICKSTDQLLLMLRWFEHAQVYHPDRVMVANGSELRRPFEDVRFKAEDGVELLGWHFPANSNCSHSQLAVLVCHGNAGNISHWLELAEAILE